MSNTIDVQAEVVKPEEPPTSTAIVKRDQQLAIGRPMSIDELHENLEFIRNVMRKEMKEGQDYGKIPGVEKDCLFQPGAQKLLMTFGLTESVKTEVVKDYPNFHREYSFVVTVKAPNGKEWDGVGVCSTLESKYRYRKAERRCPECGKNSVITGKAEFGGGYLCWKKKDGCGAKFAENDPRITSQPSGQVEFDNPPDYWNTVRKMSFKRALVAAAINATNTSELWTQDVEETGTGPDEPPRGQTSQNSAPGRKAPGGSKSPESPDRTKTPAGNQNASQGQKPQSVPKQDTKHPGLPEDAKEKELKPPLLAELRRLCGAFEPVIVRYYQSEPDKKTNVIHLMPNEGLEDLKNPTLRMLINNWDKVFPGMELWAKEHPEKPAPAPAASAPGGQDPDWWRGVIVPIPRKGMKRDAYLKDPDTIGSLYDNRADEAARNRLWYFAEKFEVETTWTNSEGKVVQRNKTQIEMDQKFRDALDAFVEWHSNKVDESAEQAEKRIQQTGDPGEDDIPF